MSEQPVLELANVLVTTTKVVINGTTYFLPNITSVKIVKDNNLRMYGVIAIILSSIVEVIALANLAPVGIAIGILGVVVGAAMFHYGLVWELVLTTGATEQHTLRAREKTTITRVLAAINVAVEQRMSR